MKSVFWVLTAIIITIAITEETDLHFIQGQVWEYSALTAATGENFFFHSKATFAFIFFLFHRWTEEKNRKSYIQTLKRCDVI